MNGFQPTFHSKATQSLLLDRFLLFLCLNGHVVDFKLNLDLFYTSNPQYNVYKSNIFEYGVSLGYVFPNLSFKVHSKVLTCTFQYTFFFLLVKLLRLGSVRKKWRWKQPLPFESCAASNSHSYTDFHRSVLTVIVKQMENRILPPNFKIGPYFSKKSLNKFRKIKTFYKKWGCFKYF